MCFGINMFFKCKSKDDFRQEIMLYRKEVVCLFFYLLRCCFWFCFCQFLEFFCLVKLRQSLWFLVFIVFLLFCKFLYYSDVCFIFRNNIWSCCIFFIIILYIMRVKVFQIFYLKFEIFFLFCFIRFIEYVLYFRFCIIVDYKRVNKNQILSLINIQNVEKIKVGKYL